MKYQMAGPAPPRSHSPPVSLRGQTFLHSKGLTGHGGTARQIKLDKAKRSTHKRDIPISWLTITRSSALRFGLGVFASRELILSILHVPSSLITSYHPQVDRQGPGSGLRTKPKHYQTGPANHSPHSSRQETVPSLKKSRRLQTPAVVIT